MEIFNQGKVMSGSSPSTTSPRVQWLHVSFGARQQIIARDKSWYLTWQSMPRMSGVEREWVLAQSKDE